MSSILHVSMVRIYPLRWWSLFLYLLLKVYSHPDSKLDAVPKKRGPKTDVLEALAKRIEGIERRLPKEKSVDKESDNGTGSSEQDSRDDDTNKPERPMIDTDVLDETAVYSPTPTPIRYVNSTNGI